MSKRLSAVFLSIALMVAAPLAAQAQTVRIAALGDSLTQGYGLLAHEGFTAQLQDWLDAQGIAATIVNAGVSGDTTSGGLSRVDWTLTDDIDAMIVALGGNDVLRGIPPELARSNLDAIMAAGKAKGVPMMIVGISVPSNYGQDYKATFETIYPDLAEKYDALYFESFLKPLTDLGDMSKTITTHIQADGIHPNARGVSVIVEAMGPMVAELAARATP
ncbi:arylesterase [Celeribacter sp.]|uniref:arylesterase n=1 Tax=Celeribacter sp. TaxID=1890673 RepID=UPI003A90E12B